MGSAIWNGKEWIGVSKLTLSEREYRLYGLEPVVHTTRIQFPPKLRKPTSGTIDFETWKRQAILISTLQKEAAIRAETMRNQ